MTKAWEYRALPVVGPAGLPDIVKAGDEGWELAGVDDGVGYFKRERVAPAAAGSPPPLPAVDAPPVLEPVVPQVLVKEVIIEKVCDGCAHFAKTGNLNKKTGLLPGFCDLHKWSTNQMQTCPKWEGKK